MEYKITSSPSPHSSSQEFTILGKKSNEYDNIKFEKILSGISYHNAADNKGLIEPFMYIAELPGKDIRGKLIECFNVWLQISEERVNDVKQLIGALHNASLLIDDIEDNSKLRRGVPVAHSIFGVPLTINCANYVYFLALAKIQELKMPTAIDVFVKELLCLHRGQGLDILWRDQGVCPSESEYKQMVIDKTGGLFRLAIGLMQAFSDTTSNEFASKDYSELLSSLGLYFQIRDDFMNICSTNYMENKSFCEDLTEGKFSFPIIHAMNLYPHDKRLMNILRQRTTDVDIKKYAVGLMIEFGSLSYTRDVLRNLYSSIIEEIDNLGGHEQLKVLVALLDEAIDIGTIDYGDLLGVEKSK